jgi:hypothetical protein
MRYALSVVVVMLVGLAAQIGHAQTDCTSPTQCASAFCVDGVCCDTACDGPQEQCNLPGERGTCVSTAAHCEAARCAVQAALDQECPCSTATNHGKHVSCVAHVVNRLAKDGTVPTNCKGKIKRCAARSICGKPGTVTCQIPQLGTCDTTTGTCVEDATIVCTSDADCVIGSRCSTKHSADLCTAAGGSVGAGTSCCADCVTSTP